MQNIIRSMPNDRSGGRRASGHQELMTTTRNGPYMAHLFDSHAPGTFEWVPCASLKVKEVGGYTGRDRWSYLLLADEIRRWSVKPDADRLELFRRMVFNAMVTNNDDHPRNHAMLRTTGGWRLSPAYDIVPVPHISMERRDLALEAGRYGRVASVYNLLSDCGSFGLNPEAAQRVINKMMEVVKGWRELFVKHGVEERSIEHISGAILPECFSTTAP